jgi:hypothetical protein
MVLGSTYFVGAVFGVYNYLRLAVTASRSSDRVDNIEED